MSRETIPAAGGAPDPLRSASPRPEGVPAPSPWLVLGPSHGPAALRLFCFPYAGGGASVFRTWPAGLPRGVQVCAVQLPGRETRMLEAPLTSLPAVVETLATEVAACAAGTPYAFFGHSLGAKIAYEVALALVHAGDAGPSLLVAAGAAAPHVPPRRRPIHALARDQFVAELGKLGGTPSEILAERELMDLFLPVLRADFALDERYVRDEAVALPCPIVACSGERDDTVPAQGVAEWGRYTRAALTTREFRGDHFFLRSHEPELLGFLGAALSNQA